MLLTTGITPPHVHLAFAETNDFTVAAPMHGNRQGDA